eukprot:scaffold4201_cov119-Isochrysis_galbana.AAC.4
MWGEVVRLVPPVVEGRQPGSEHLLLQLGVVHPEAAEACGRRLLDGWLRDGEEQGVEAGHGARAELLAGGDELDLLAVPEEDRRLARADEDAAAPAQVDSHASRPWGRGWRR